MSNNTISSLLAKQYREFYTGKNWTWSWLKDTIEDITLDEATTTIGDHNSILVLIFHLHYYSGAFKEVLLGHPLTSNDKYAFTPPELKSEEEWQQYKNRLFKEAEAFAVLVEKLDDDRLSENIPEEKYGSYFRNIAGIIEHNHYHLGQIALVKKLIRSR